MVPENIHTLITEGIENSGGVGMGGHEEPGDDPFSFQMSFDSIWIQVSI